MDYSSGLIQDVAAVVIPTIVGCWVIIKIVVRHTTDKIVGDEMNMIKKDISAKLFRQDGITHYIPRKECKESRDECGTRTCREITKVAASVNKIIEKMEENEGKRDATRGELTRALTSLTVGVHTLKGRFDQYLEDHRNGGVIK